MLISQPGSDYQVAQITLDAGHARDIMLLLIDTRAVLNHLYRGGARPGITAPAREFLRFTGSPYTLHALIQALDDVAVQLGHAECQAFRGIPRSTPGHGRPIAADHDLTRRGF
jgi:hypothetical protein